MTNRFQRPPLEGENKNPQNAHFRRGFLSQNQWSINQQYSILTCSSSTYVASFYGGKRNEKKSFVSKFIKNFN